MANDFINWDDLDLNDVLGENNWTDADEQNDILGPEQEWFSSDDSFPPEVQQSTANGNGDDKENRTPKARGRKNYKCPLCDKDYTSTSGFRGHVVKKHNRPDIKGLFNLFIISPQPEHTINVQCAWVVNGAKFN